MTFMRVVQRDPERIDSIRVEKEWSASEDLFKCLCVYGDDDKYVLIRVRIWIFHVKNTAVLAGELTRVTYVSHLAVLGPRAVAEEFEAGEM